VIFKAFIVVEIINQNKTFSQEEGLMVLLN